MGIMYVEGENDNLMLETESPSNSAISMYIGDHCFVEGRISLPYTSPSLFFKT